MEKELKFRNTHQMDLTRGKLFFKIPLFVLPLAATTIFQLLYTTIDLWTVSKFGGGSQSMAAVGSNSALINLIVTLLVSLATGSNVAIAQAKGAKNKDKAEKILHTSFIIAFVGGLLFSIIGYFLSGKLLILMGTPVSILDKATEYVKIYFLGLPLFMIYNFGSQMLRALGDSKRPFYFLVISGIVNVILDFIFVKYFGLDVIGVGIATVISGFVSALLTILWFIFSKGLYVNLHLSKLKIDKESFNQILSIGVPAGIQGLAFCIPNVMIQSSLYTIDNHYINNILMTQDEIVAGAAAAEQVNDYMFCACNAFSLGCVSFTGQNFGAKNKKNIKKTFFYSILWMMIVWAIGTALIFSFSSDVLQIFLEEGSNINLEHSIWCGQEKLYIITITYFLDGIMDICGSFLRGMNVSTPPAILTLAGCTGTRILFLLTLFKLDYFHTIFWLYMAFPISWIIVDLVYIPLLLHYKKKVLDPIE